MLLAGRIAIVSGIGPGMGRDISLRLAREGADIVMGARSRGSLEPLAKEVEALGRRAVWLETDLTDKDAGKRLVDKAVREFGRVDVLVNNAFHTGTMTPFESDDLETGWRDTHEVNLWGTLRMTQAVLPVMKAQQSGSIVMINTMTIRVVNPGLRGLCELEGGPRGGDARHRARGRPIRDPRELGHAGLHLGPVGEGLSRERGRRRKGGPTRTSTPRSRRRSRSGGSRIPTRSRARSSSSRRISRRASRGSRST